MTFRTWLEAKRPFTPDYILPNVHRIIPAYIMKRIPYYGQKMITIYHGGSFPEDPVDDIKCGDWVSLSRGYAQIHANARGSKKVIKKRVPAEHVSWAGTDENEWFYTPPSGDNSMAECSLPKADVVGSSPICRS